MNEIFDTLQASQDRPRCFWQSMLWTEESKVNAYIHTSCFIYANECESRSIFQSSRWMSGSNVEEYEKEQTEGVLALIQH